jgi:hypothetical protein
MFWGMFRSGLSLFALLQLAAFSSLAAGTPDCLSHGQAIGVNNDQVLKWETTTANQYLDRAHVSGAIVAVYPDHSGHSHFGIQIGPNSSDTIEIIYNQDFGSVPTPTVGQQVEACGDYITSTAQAGPYPPSPDHAIVHWVHEAPNPQKHPSGYLMINGVLYGYSLGQGGGQSNGDQTNTDQNNTDQNSTDPTQNNGQQGQGRHHHHGHGG